MSDAPPTDDDEYRSPLAPPPPEPPPDPNATLGDRLLAVIYVLSPLIRGAGFFLLSIVGLIRSLWYGLEELMRWQLAALAWVVLVSAFRGIVSWWKRRDGKR